MARVGASAGAFTPNSAISALGGSVRPARDGLPKIRDAVARAVVVAAVGELPLPEALQRQPPLSPYLAELPTLVPTAICMGDICICSHGRQSRPTVTAYSHDRE